MDDTASATSSAAATGSVSRNTVVRVPSADAKSYPRPLSGDASSTASSPTAQASGKSKVQSVAKANSSAKPKAKAKSQAKPKPKAKPKAKRSSSSKKSSAKAKRSTKSVKKPSAGKPPTQKPKPSVPAKETNAPIEVVAQAPSVQPVIPTPAVPSGPEEDRVIVEPSVSSPAAAIPVSVKKWRPPLRRMIKVRIEKISLGKQAFEMIEIPGGRFLMGAEQGSRDELPVHQVSIKPFLLGRYEVTQAQWRAVMGESPPAFSTCERCPVGSVSWNDVQSFLEKLNKRTQRNFRLPSEAEWEYACRSGGADELYCGGLQEEAEYLGYFAANSQGRPQPVGSLHPNGLGLYDMSGNAYEWVADCWNSHYEGAPVDGSAWLSGDCERRVLRGGAWFYSLRYSRASYRNANDIWSRFNIYGFRLALDP